MVPGLVQLQILATTTDTQLHLARVAMEFVKSEEQQHNRGVNYASM
jgi:hypothetical protein